MRVAFVNIEALRLRAALNALFRLYFAERDVLEVETPILSEAGNTEPNIESFTTTFTGHADAGSRTRWMRRSMSRASTFSSIMPG